MKIPKISEVAANIAKSSIGQKVYGKLLDPKHETFINNTLPLMESAVCTASYIYATATNKKIPEERKPILQWQNVLNGAIGITISGGLNKFVSKKGAEISKKLDPSLVKNFDKVVSGVKVGLPILTTALVMRLGVSYLTVPMSAAAKKIDGIFRKPKNDKKLDIKG